VSDLGVLSGSNYSHSYAINESGTVVGQGKNSSGSLRAVVWKNGGSALDLNSLDSADSGWTLVTATAVSDNGFIAGTGRSRSGSSRAFLLTPTSGATVSGTAWNDADADGVRDSGEKPLPGAQLYVDADRDGNLDPGERVTTSDASGNYFFTGMSSGTWRVRMTPPTAMRASMPSVGYLDVTLTSTQHATSKNFLATRSTSTTVSYTTTSTVTAAPKAASVWNSIDGVY
jgi:probable HAF family extracellular repeat protein